MPVGAPISVRLAALLHDAAEGWTGDIPRPYKVREQAVFESTILREICEGLGAPMFAMDTHAVGIADDIAALAEAEVFVRPAERRVVWENYDRPVSARQLEEAENTVWSMRDMTRWTAINKWVWNVQALIKKEEY